MKAKIEYLLKHNMFVQKMYKIFMSAFFRFIGIFIRINKKMILFSSFMGKSYNDSPRCIYEYLKANANEDYTYVWAFEEPEKFKHLGCKVVKIDTFKYFIYALKAKYWVTCVNIERGLKFKKKKTIYLNTWHGIAMKKIGNDCEGRKDYDFSKINYFCVSSEYDKKVFASAFKTSEQNYFSCGMPRNDELFYSLNNPEYKKELLEKLNLPTNKKIILYAPTWRDSIDNGKTYKVDIPVDFKKWEKELGKDYIVLFRAHVKTTEIMKVEFNDFLRNYSNYECVNHLMIVSDLLITDYSAISFDYSILEKPIFCYGYDYEQYVSERGLYITPKELFTSGVIQTENELLNCIKTLDYKLESKNTKLIKNKFIEFGGNATEECAKVIINNSKK